jgi:Skp family chaperone for outer membrane proteins
MTDPYRFYGDMVQMNNEMAMKGMDAAASGLQSLANAYADRKSTEAKADSYAKIGEILGSTMFQNNPQAAQALADLKKEKDPYARTMGYEALLSFAGPYSNFVMANRNAGIRENQQQLTAAMPGLRNQATAQAQVAAGQGRMTGLPPGVNPAAIPTTR